VATRGAVLARQEPRSDAARHPPRVWVLADDRPGNTTQSIGLAETLGWPYELKRLQCRWPSRLHNRLLGAHRLGIDARRSSPLEPPWPDLVIAAGRRTAPVALWIRKRAGGDTKIVMLGRKGADDARRFDLAVTPSYCRLLPHPRRVEIAAPLHRVSEALLAEARRGWQERLGAARRPRIALLVGGTSGQYRLGAAVARRLAADVVRMSQSCGGSVFVTTSRRLGAAATHALCSGMQEVAHLHRWTPRATENPYLGYLALADAFVITGDSESMLSEACSLGKPVYVYPLPVRRSFRILSTPRDAVWRRAVSGRGALARICSALIERGWVRPARDLDRFHAALQACGAARRFAGVYDPAHAAAPLHDRDAVAARVRALWPHGAGAALPL